ncbi:MAG: DUF58 domain-containing protein [Rhodospirillaceae bacterium]|nr:DUF58 domain-containing protein [Rhodospirillaceae bacterium]
MQANARVSDVIMAVMAVVVLLGVLVDRPSLIALGATVAVLSLIGRVWVRWSLFDIETEYRTTYSRVFEGESFELSLTVENRKALPVPWIGITEFVPEGLTVHETGGETRPHLNGTNIVLATALGPHQSITVRHRLYAARRGRYRFTPTHLRSGDLFAFYTNDRTIDVLQPDFTVYPRIVPLPALRLPSAQPLGDATNRVWGVDDAMRPNGLREYRSGEPARHIDWKATARRGEPFVRLFDRTVTQSVVLIAECDIRRAALSGARGPFLERTVVAAASVAADCAKRGYQIGLICNGVPRSERVRPYIPPGRGSSQLPVVLETLAVAGSATTQDMPGLIEKIGAKSIPFGATVVCVTANFDPPTEAMLRALQSRGNPTVTLFVGPGATPRAARLDIRDFRPLLTAAVTLEEYPTREAVNA